jgi:hypothetical protein
MSVKSVSHLDSGFMAGRNLPQHESDRYHSPVHALTAWSPYGSGGSDSPAGSGGRGGDAWIQAMATAEAALTQATAKVVPPMIRATAADWPERWISTNSNVPLPASKLPWGTRLGVYHLPARGHLGRPASPTRTTATAVPLRGRGRR